MKIKDCFGMFHYGGCLNEELINDLIEILRPLEWIDGFCPSCSAAKTQAILIAARRSGWGGSQIGHRADCKLFAAISGK